jgi:threonine synthase
MRRAFAGTFGSGTVKYATGTLSRPVPIGRHPLGRRIRAAVRFDDASSSELAMTILDSSTGSTVRPVDPWHATILDSIGDTPLIRVDGVWVKLEFLNPSGSIKARIAKYLIEKAEAEGLLQPGDTIVEASSGNTGNAMSMVAALARGSIR